MTDKTTPEVLEDASYDWPAIGATVRRVDQLRAAGLGPLDILTKLVREVRAGQCLVALSTTPHEQRLAALDALALARDVLDDAQARLAADTAPEFTGGRDRCACGAVRLVDDAAGHVVRELWTDTTTHAAAACLQHGGRYTWPEATQRTAADLEAQLVGDRP